MLNRRISDKGRLVGIAFFQHYIGKSSGGSDQQRMKLVATSGLAALRTCERSKACYPELLMKT